MSGEERLRREYLANMGIDSYLPRFALPGAKPSPRPVVVQAAPATNTAPETLRDNPVDAGPVQTAPAATPTVNDSPAAIPAERLQLADNAPTVPSGDAEVRFQALFTRVNGSICALNQLPYAGGRRGLGSEEQRLFANICRALGLDTSGISFDTIPFRWPLSESGHIDKSESAARSAVKAYLSQKLSEHDFKVLLVLGSGISGVLSANHGTGGGLSLNGRVCETVFTRSLDEMLRMPQLKREVWNQLSTRSWHDLR